ncbi:hypothetical protein EVAR_21892_1 [Eumeta japonica]|uniref:Uncharacterized protein n=1 Tax=Eumeta variegata TaxID=151549 RepID=A0A4C2A491_EUMVA|nr:hypothetical protein EVAR_21892_1 [Eumeta japonica]
MRRRGPLPPAASVDVSQTNVGLSLALTSPPLQYADNEASSHASYAIPLPCYSLGIVLKWRKRRRTKWIGATLSLPPDDGDATFVWAYGSYRLLQPLVQMSNLVIGVCGYVRRTGAIAVKRVS